MWFEWFKSQAQSWDTSSGLIEVWLLGATELPFPPPNGGGGATEQRDGA
jgi:hypothetical protein